jgi:cellulose synthase/poly-beta-1,6-N-acetylglucosamine synthase-like glycosyltransferase
MLQLLANLMSIPILAILLVFNLRRILFTYSILRPRKGGNHKGQGSQIDFPTVLILVPCRDEEEMVPGLCRSLIQLEYPQEKLQVVLIDDGSRDGTRKAMEEGAQNKPGWRVLSLQDNAGKASALNTALASFHFGEIIYIFDADHRPDWKVIQRAVRYFDDPRVAGVSGYTKIANPTASPSAYYSTVESYINQLVTMRTKDRLDLAPALLGSNCGYQRKYLLECGGFRKDAFSEDSDLTVAFYQAGYRVRFAEDAISYQQVPQSVRAYLKQHIRWGRGLSEVAKTHSVEIFLNQKLSLPLRVELLLFSSGYLDRLALVAGGILAYFSSIRAKKVTLQGKVFAFALLMPFVQILALFYRENMPWTMWIRLPLVPLFFLLDIYAASRSMLDFLFSRKRVWTKTERTLIQQDDNDRYLYH